MNKLQTEALWNRAGCPILNAPLAFRVGHGKALPSIVRSCPIHFASFAKWTGNYKLALLLLLTICFSVRPVAAQQPAIHDLAQRVDRHYNKLKSLKAEFTESYEGLGRSRTESGTLLLQKPGRMRWDYSRPAGKLFLLDGKYAWFYSRGDLQVQRIEAKKLDDLRSPLRFLLGHTQLEKEIDHLSASPAANGNFNLTGVPHNQENRIQRLTLTVTTDGIIIGIEIQETDGAITRFFFAGEQPNPAIPPNTFRFTPPAGIPVINGMGPV
jgi:outer membrane lipoprotein carrier protein